MYTGQFTIQKSWTDRNLSAYLSTNLYGPQQLPSNRSREKSPVFAIANIGLTKSIGSFDLSLDVKNLTDWVQGDNPFQTSPSGEGNIIDSAMIYGPLLGRTVGIGLAYSFDL